MADPTEDTQRLDMQSVLGDSPADLPVNRDELPPALSKRLGWDVDGDGQIRGIEKDVPEPLVLRGVVMTAVGLVGAIVGKSLDLTWIDPAIGLYALSAPMVLALWGRLHVAPVSKT